MGKTNSKTASTPSFDHIKSTKKAIGGRKKNSSTCLSNKPYQLKNAVSLSNESLPYVVENTILIWLDGSLDKQTEYNQKSLGQFLRVMNIVQIFSDLEKCFDFMSLIKDELIFFVVSGALGPQILPRIENFNQIYSVYLFCGNRANHEVWTKQYRIIKGIHTNIKELCNALRYDFRQYDKSLTSISSIPLTSTVELNETNKEFICLHLLKSSILEIQYDKRFRKDFLDYCRPFYSNNGPQLNTQLNIIESFEETYAIHSPIWWYTRKCFLYTMLRKAFHVQNFEIMYKLAFFIRDLHRDIKKSYLQTHNHQHHPLTVYRATTMTNDEFANIEKNQDGLLSFNDFVLATLERSIALKCASTLRTNSNSIAILYTLDIDPSTSSIPFIALNNLSYLANTDGEILFSMNTIFHIDRIEKLYERVYEITLSPASKKDEQIKNLVECMQTLTHGLSGWYKLSKIMLHINEYDQVEHIYNYIYDQTNENHREERAFLQHELGYVHELKNNLTTSVNHYKQAINIYSSFLPPNYATLLPTYTNLAAVLQKQGDLSGALEQYQNALKIEKSDNQSAVVQHNNIATILQQQGKYAEAQQIFEKSVQTLLDNSPVAYPILADTFHHMAGLFYSTRNYAKALVYYDKTLGIDEKSLPSSNPSLPSTYFNIATTYEAMKDTPKAIKHAEKAVNTARLIFGDEHFETKENINYLEQLRPKHQSAEF